MRMLRRFRKDGAFYHMDHGTEPLFVCKSIGLIERCHSLSRWTVHDTAAMTQQP